MNKAPIPLRARKKIKLRRALIAASFRLFNRKGYTATTLEEISASCDVTVQTLLRYFGSKDDLIFAGHPAILEKFSSRIAHAVETKSVVRVWRKFMRAMTLKLQSDREIANTYKIIAGAPSLLARFFAIARQYELLVERALCEEAGAKAGEDIHSVLLAHLLVTATIEDALQQIERGKLDTVSERCDAIADYALQHFPRPNRLEPRKTSKVSDRARATRRAAK